MALMVRIVRRVLRQMLRQAILHQSTKHYLLGFRRLVWENKLSGKDNLNSRDV